LGEALNVIKDDWKGDWNIGGTGRRCNRPAILALGMAGAQATGYLWPGSPAVARRRNSMPSSSNATSQSN